eukprot:CAMPEP_0119164794 /NCGR_PEP_ID=MMETSP1315-20130426/4588_1 /TAXON_ID=676789 /ORGANISM="Prasinoderma singularis, Strain RCC927" /LENGTH=76 /DNA_ID=CAMNT_0007158001 /DNA_START=46 /DNA_END=272 /DNA_ORIENTATION=-
MLGRELLRMKRLEHGVASQHAPLLLLLLLGVRRQQAAALHLLRPVHWHRRAAGALAAVRHSPRGAHCEQLLVGAVR